MNKLIPLLAGALLWAGSAHAQEAKTFTLTVSNQDLQVLSAGLDELPRKVSQPLVERLQRQLVPQMQPVSEPAKEPEKEEGMPPGYERYDGSHIRKVAEPPKAEEKK